MATTKRPLVSAGMFLGLGMGGFVDGILFHQILQIHGMLTAVRPKDSFINYEINMVWDGIFHAATWMATAMGLFLLFRAGRRPDVPWSGRVLVGAMVLGWGVFNLVEGIIDHHILHIHHVVEAQGVSVWDYVFLASGIVMIIAGLLIIGGAPERAPRGAPAH
jgi:uncharacterized membrane protein